MPTKIIQYVSRDPKIQAVLNLLHSSDNSILLHCNISTTFNTYFVQQIIIIKTWMHLDCPEKQLTLYKVLFQYRKSSGKYFLNSNLRLLFYK